MITSGQPIPAELVECEVVRPSGEKVKIGRLISQSSAFLLFVRHFGCIGCSENVGLLSSRFSELVNLEVRTVIIGVGPAMFIEPFRERQNLIDAPVEIVTDPTLTAHKTAGLMYGLWGGLRPKALFQMARAFTNGHVSRPAEGDIKQHAGAILVDRHGIVQLYHRNASLGDHVNGQEVVDTALNGWLAEHPEVV